MAVSSQKRKGTQSAQKNRKRTQGDDLSLSPLDFESAIRAAMATGKAPPAPKKKAKAKRKGGK